MKNTDLLEWQFCDCDEFNKPFVLASLRQLDTSQSPVEGGTSVEKCLHNIRL